MTHYIRGLIWSTSDRYSIDSERQQTLALAAHGFQVDRQRRHPSGTRAGNHEKGRIMLQYTSSPERSQNRSRLTIMQMLRFPIVWLGLVMVLATPTIILATTWAVQAETPVSADLFMQSVVKRDGALGWHQLCPALQAQEPLSALTSQVQQQRNAESKQGLTLTMDYIGAHARPQGGQIRMYIVTARLPNGWVAQRTYIVSTQASGCVDDVNNV